MAEVMEYMLDKHLMRKLGGSLEEDLDVVLTLVDRDGMKPVVEALKDHQALENQVHQVQAEGAMTCHLDLVCQVILHGKDQKGVQIVAIGDQGVLEGRRTMVGGYQVKDQVIDRINGEVLNYDCVVVVVISLERDLTKQILNFNCHAQRLEWENVVSI